MLPPKYASTFYTQIIDYGLQRIYQYAGQLFLLSLRLKTRCQYAKNVAGVLYK